MEKIDLIYLIDDDDTYRFIFQLMAEDTDMVKTIKEFSSGYEPFQLIKSLLDHQEDLPQIIFLDLNMPKMNGWEFLEEYRAIKSKIQKKIKTFIVSSSMDPIDQKKAKTYCCVEDFIIKPFTEDKFKEIVARIQLN